MITDFLNKKFNLWGVCSYERIKNNLLDCRAKSRLPENAESVVVIAFPYLLSKEVYENSNISKYAVVPDYHDYISDLLKKICNELKEQYPDYLFECFADNSPLPEVEAACLAGIGIKGMNSLLITKDYGSFVFLGEIVTDMKIEPTGDKINECEKCGKCALACPGKAIENGKIDKEKCLSHITQKKGDLNDSETALIKSTGCIWGCDICQNVCPHNINAKTTDIAEFINGAEPILTSDSPLEGRAYGWRGEKVVKRNINITQK